MKKEKREKRKEYIKTKKEKLKNLVLYILLKIQWLL